MLALPQLASFGGKNVAALVFVKMGRRGSASPTQGQRLLWRRSLMRIHRGDLSKM